MHAQRSGRGMAPSHKDHTLAAHQESCLIMVTQLASEFAIPHVLVRIPLVKMPVARQSFDGVSEARVGRT